MKNKKEIVANLLDKKVITFDEALILMQDSFYSQNKGFPEKADEFAVTLCGKKVPEPPPLRRFNEGDIPKPPTKYKYVTK